MLYSLITTLRTERIRSLIRRMQSLLPFGLNFLDIICNNTLNDGIGLLVTTRITYFLKVQSKSSFTIGHIYSLKRSLTLIHIDF